MDQSNEGALRIIPPAEASARTGLSLSTIKRYTRAGLFPPKVHRGIRGVGYVESDVAAFIEEATKGTAPGKSLSPEASKLYDRLLATRERARSSIEQTKPFERACADAYVDVARAAEAVSRTDVSRRGAEFASKRLEGTAPDDVAKKEDEQRTTDVLCAKAREAAVAIPFLDAALAERRAHHAAIIDEERQVICDLVGLVASERLRDGIALAKDAIELCVESYVIARFASLFMAGSVPEIFAPLSGGKNRQIPSWMVQQINWSIPTHRLLENETLPGQRDITGAQILKVDDQTCHEMTHRIMGEFDDLGIEIPEEHRSWP